MKYINIQFLLEEKDANKLKNMANEDGLPLSIFLRKKVKKEIIKGEEK